MTTSLAPVPHVLVTGSPGSGTTAVGRWLLAQPGAAGRLQSRVTVAVHEGMRPFSRNLALADRRLRAAIALGDMAYELYDLEQYDEGKYVRADSDGTADVSLLVDQEPLEPVPLPQGDHLDYLDHLVEVLGSKFIFVARHPLAVVDNNVHRTWGHSLAGKEPWSMGVAAATEIWAKCYESVLQFTASRAGRGLVVKLESLVAAPERESARVLQFLGVGASHWSPFQPQAAGECRLSAEDQAFVLRETRDLRKVLGYI